MTLFLVGLGGFTLGWLLCLTFCIHKYIEMQRYYEEKLKDQR